MLNYRINDNRNQSSNLPREKHSTMLAVTTDPLLTATSVAGTNCNARHEDVVNTTKCRILHRMAPQSWLRPVEGRTALTKLAYGAANTQPSDET
jgi:hypothetical protein